MGEWYDGWEVEVRLRGRTTRQVCEGVGEDGNPVEGPDDQAGSVRGWVRTEVRLRGRTTKQDRWEWGKYRKSGWGTGRPGEEWVSGVKAADRVSRAAAFACPRFAV